MSDTYYWLAAKADAQLAAFDAKIQFWNILIWLSLWWMLSAGSMYYLLRFTQIWREHPKCRIPIFLVFAATIVLHIICRVNWSHVWDAKIAFVGNGYK